MENMQFSRNELRTKQIMILTDGMDQFKSRYVEKSKAGHILKRREIVIILVFRKFEMK